MNGPTSQQTIRLLIAYDGTLYRGWQKQPNQPTIQGKLESALSQIAGEEISVTGAGRTDAGVHALAQTAHFTTSQALEEDVWVRAANSLLPEDIAVLSARFVPPDFHARYDALSKEYQYRIHNQSIRSPFVRMSAWHVPRALSLEAMREGAQILLGTHDFSAFRAAECGAKSPVRTLQRIDIASDLPPLVTLTFEAESFLHHMVRNIVGTLVQIGKGEIPPSGIAAILSGKDRRKAGPTAPAHGLWLVRILYPE